MKIHGKDQSKKSTQIGGIIIGIIAVIACIKQMMNGGTPFLLILAIGIVIIAFYKKRVEISEDGYDELMIIAGIRRHSLWKWEEINFLFADFKKAAPDATIIVRKGNVTKSTVVDPDSVQQILDWAADGNAAMKIQYNGTREFHVKGRNKMTEEEYAKMRGEINAKPRNFHEMAEVARKTKREILLRKPDPKKLKVKRNRKRLSKCK